MGMFSARHVKAPLPVNRMQKYSIYRRKAKKTFRFAKNNITLQFVEKDKQPFIHLIHLDYVTIISSNTSCGFRASGRR
jgi:hypothetical protein